MATTTRTEDFGKDPASGKYVKTVVETTTYDNGAVAEAKTVTTTATYGFRDSVRHYYYVTYPGGMRTKVSGVHYPTFRGEQADAEYEAAQDAN